MTVRTTTERVRILAAILNRGVVVGVGVRGTLRGKAQQPPADAQYEVEQGLMGRIRKEKKEKDERIAAGQQQQDPRRDWTR